MQNACLRCRSERAVPRILSRYILSYCHYCLNDTGLTRLFPMLSEQMPGVINAAALGMGLLTNQGVPDWYPASVHETCAKAAAFCRAQGQDISKLALQFAMANPAIHSTLVGMADPAILLKNVACLETLLDQSLLSKVQKRLAPIHNQSWPSGRPENNDVA